MKFLTWAFSKMLGKKNDQIKTKAVAGGGLVTAAMVSAALFIGIASQHGQPMTGEFEGLVLKNYRDSVGVLTWCRGETQMGYLPDGDYTKEYCETLFSARYPQYSAKQYQCYNEKMKRYVTPKMHAGLTDVFYNTGSSCKTGMMRALKRGDPVGSCEYILRYKYAGGKDCSIRSNNCYGVWKRRVAAYDLCIDDAKQIPPDGLGEEDANSVD